MEIAGAIVSKVAEFTLELTVKQGRYLFCFNGIVKDLKEGEKNLRSKWERMENRVKSAENNNEKIYEDVKKWLNDSSIILDVVQRLDAEIEEKRSCLNGWCCRYCLSRKVVKNTSIMLKRVDEYDKIEAVGQPAPLPGIEFLAPEDFQLFQSSKAAFDQVIEALRNDEINLVGLYGMGGSGKTTLAKTLGIEVKERGIFNEVVMVVVSQTPNFKDMQSKLAESLGVELREEDDIEKRAKQLYLRLTETNRDTNKRSLVILDDVWKKFDLKAKIGFPFGEDNKHCKILLTTRRQQLCVGIGCQSQIPLGLLNTDEGLTLLKRYAGINDEHITSELKALAILVAGECNGLPLAITTIGRALKEKSIDEWKLVFEKLKKSKLVDAYDVLHVDDEDVYACLKLSYDHLRDKETKFCFLLCSLFPEDYEISVEELVLYGIGLGLFSDTDLIENARSRLLVILNSLRDSCLLLDGRKKCVKMHDMVRDVALWIASKGKNVFMSKHGMGPIAWSKEKGWEQYTAISLSYNEIEELPIGLVCPKLEIFLLGGIYFKKLKISDECFKWMKALKVLYLKDADLSLKSLQSLTNLKTLKLIDCTLRDIFCIEKLNELEILYLRSSSLVELPRELSKLHKLRWLSFNRPDEELVRIPSNLIRGCSQLEELYISENFSRWEIEEKWEEKSNASLFELNSLSRLVSLCLRIDARYLPKNFAFPRLQRYDICVSTSSTLSYYSWSTLSYNSWSASPNKRILEISNIEATSLTAFKALYGTLEYLCLDKTTGCQNIVPGIDQGGLNELKSLTLKHCNDLKCILDTSLQNVPADAFTNFVELSLAYLMLLKEICFGGRLPKGFLEKLETIRVYSCSDICSLFPTELLLRLHKLKKVEISFCDKLQEVFLSETDELCYIGKENDLVLLPSLIEIRLQYLPQLMYIWNGPTHHVNLGSLVSLYIESCERLEHIFPISFARGLVQLKQLVIKDCHQLKQVFFTDNGSEENAAGWDGKDIMLPKLRELILDCLASLTSFLPESYHASLPVLKVLKISKCSRLTTLISNVKMRDQEQNTCSLFQMSLSLHKLKEVEIASCDKLEEVFPISIARGLVQLEQLIIEDSHQLKQVFFTDNGSEEHVAGRDGKNIILPKVRKLTLGRLASLASLLPGTYHASWPALEVLKIYECSSLTTLISIIKMQDQEQTTCSLHKLKIVEILSCDKLQKVFPISIVRGLAQLKQLTIKDSHQLKQVFFLDNGTEENIAERDGKDIILPKLRELKLDSLPSLASFFPKSYHASWTALEVLKIYKCSSLTTLISNVKMKDQEQNACSLFQMHMRLPKLKEVEISFCDQLQQVFQFQTEGLSYTEKENGLVLLSSLIEIRLQFLPQLRYIWNGPTYHVNLQSLASLYIKSCERLEHIFPISVARGLVQLEHLIIEDSPWVKQVFFMDNESEENVIGRDAKVIMLPKLREVKLVSLGSLASLLPKSYRASWPALEVLKVDKCFNLTNLISDVKMQDEKLGVLSLQKLTNLYINECHKLRHLFSSTLAGNMKQLRELKIGSCGQLEQIIFKDDEEDHLLSEEIAVDNREIVLLPKLKKLSIKALPKLTSICPMGYHPILNLETLWMIGFQDNRMCLQILGCLRDVKEMDIRDCGLKEIEFGLCKAATSTQTLTFRNLSKLFFSECHKLRRIVVPLPNLLQLSQLAIVECEELEEIIIVEDDDDEVVIHKDRADDGDEVTSYHKQFQLVLPRLQRLCLNNLGSLAKFCPGNYHLIFPSLTLLIVKGCGKMETRFLHSRGEKGSVHVHAEAAAKAPKQGLNCYGSEGFQIQLPAMHYSS